MNLNNEQQRLVTLTKQIASLLTKEEVSKLGWTIGTLTILESAAALLGYRLTEDDEPTTEEEAFMNYALAVMDQILDAECDVEADMKGVEKIWKRK